jgi:hypothetical protein
VIAEHDRVILVVERECRSTDANGLDLMAGGLIEENHQLQLAPPIVEGL